jgi:pyridinium-3,5-bisthiocarboxylic acid mononucleotide nickel chelatase
MSQPDDHPHPHPHSHAGPFQASTEPAAGTPLIYVDCFSGISGDMLLGALLDAGLPLEALEAGLAKLDLGGYHLDVQTKHSYGIAGTRLDVRVDEAVQPERRLAEILALLERSDLPAWVRAGAEAVFRRLGEAEAKIHATTVDAVHFHEVGGVDSIVDIVGGLIGLHALGVTRIHASSLPLPGGTVRARHGLLPAPAPATLEILARVGAPTRPAPVLGELVTPTGAAILAELATFEQPSMRVHRVGYGYGTRELPWPNAVRVWLGEPWAPAPPRVALTPPAPLSAPERGPGGEGGSAPEQQSGGEVLRQDEVVVIEANLDDATPELLGYAMERLFEAGALDVFFTPIQMKKNRPGTLLGVIGRPERASDLVLTPFGLVRVKLKLLGDRSIAAPEYDDCARVAQEQGVPLADVYRAAQIAAERIT